MEVPTQLIENIKRGKVVLFLGSGALYGASLPENKKIPLGDDLRDLICSRFLNDAFKQDNLAHVSAMAISQSSLFELQDYIKNYLNDLTPSDFHKKIPLFKWRALFTTNYDLLIETVYNEVKSRLQEIKIILGNEDSIDETRLTSNIIPYLKLHGCISRTHDNRLPLILTTDQYNEFRKNRDRLFRHLYELAYENTILFIGHSLQDFNIRSILLELEKEAPQGQRHYLLKPGIQDIEKEYWAGKKISALDMTFEQLINELDSNISLSDRALSLVGLPSTHPIESRFSSHTKASKELIDSLSNSIELINSSTPSSSYLAKDFFRGMDLGWGPIIDDLPIKRNLQKQIIELVAENPDAERSINTDFYVLKGEAGSGKTILLRQLAWEIQSSGLGIVVWVREGCSVDFDLLEEISFKSNDRIYLFWDNAAINSIEINRTLQKSSNKNLSITLVSAERYNEWNNRCNDLDEITTSYFEIKYLSEDEIISLVQKLRTYDCLGPNLSDKSHADQCKELKEIYGRQLLVALHEATMGEPFEDIIFNEFKSIIPENAAKIYLSVCTLNRLRIPVRAGLISRIHEISFEEFKNRFYRPLEKVVLAKGGKDQDMHYQARHPEIAEIVFRRALSNNNDRYNEYISIISKLNLSFSSDRSSFRIMIRAKSLNELFQNYEDVDAIYKHAEQYIGDDPYLLQQMANYERIRPNGSLDKALKLLLRAKDLSPHDSSIVHSLSVVWRDKAKDEKEPHSRRKGRSEARAYLDQISSKWGASNYTSISIIELSLANLEDLIDDEYSTEASLRDSIRNIQSDITSHKQRYSNDGRASSLEFKFAEILKDNEKALNALERSFEENNRDPYIAIRLSNTYLENKKLDQAEKTLKLALERRRNDHKLNFSYAELLRSKPNKDTEIIKYYYRRAFTPGDKNFEAQFWFARYTIESMDINESNQAEDIFNYLRGSRISFESRNKIRDIDGGEDNPIKHFGVVTKKRTGFGFIKMDGIGLKVFMPEKSFEDGIWDAVIEGDRVTFNLGFAYSGAIAINIKA